MFRKINPMSTALLRDKIHRAIDKIDDEHLLECVLTLVDQNINGFEFDGTNFAMSEERKKTFDCKEAKALAVNEVKKRILENLEK